MLNVIMLSVVMLNVVAPKMIMINFVKFIAEDNDFRINY
jgi:hypothetical protein